MCKLISSTWPVPNGDIYIYIYTYIITYIHIHTHTFADVANHLAYLYCCPSFRISSSLRSFCAGGCTVGASAAAAGGGGGSM